MHFRSKSLFIPVIIAVAVICHGCGIPLFPIPIVKYAPTTVPLPEKSATPLVLAALKDVKDSAFNLTLAIRSGRIQAVAHPKTEVELIAARDLLKILGYHPSAYGAFILGGYLGERQ